MKIAHVLMAGAVIALMSSTTARAADAPAAGAPKAEDFAAHKAKMVDNMQKKLDCVKAANDREAVGNCFPRWKGRAEHMKEQHGGMMKDGAPPGDGPPK